MADEAKKTAKKLRKMGDRELIRDLADEESQNDERLIAAEYQRRSLGELATMNRRLWMLLCVNTFMLITSVAAVFWAVATYAWWLDSEGDWDATRKKSRASLELARRQLSDGADTLSSAFDDALSEFESRKKGKKSWF